MVASEERHPDSVEAQVGDERDGHLAVDTKDLHSSSEGCESPADGQGEDGVHAYAHAGVVRRPRGEADGPHLKPPPRAPEKQVGHHSREQGDEKPVVSPSEPDKRDAGRYVNSIGARYEALGSEG